MDLRFYFALITLAIMLIFRFTKEKDSMRIEWSAVASFVGFLAAIFAFRFLLMNYSVNNGGPLPSVPKEVDLQLYSLGFVFWEDMFFAVPIYLMQKYMKKRWLFVSLSIILSVLFGIGHAYQGMSTVLIMCFLPYFVTVRFGKKYGFGTTMVCHVLYDLSTVLTVKMVSLLFFSGMM